MDCYRESAEQLFRALDGEPVDQTRICLGDDSPTRLLGSDGSQNWPVAAQAAIYVESGDGAWFDRYLGIQINGEVGFMGKELFSYAYGPAIVGPIMVVLKEAEERDHRDLARQARQWLRTYWAVHALGSSATRITDVKLLLDYGELSFGVEDDSYRGLAVAKGAARSMVTGTKDESRYELRFPAAGLDKAFLTLALDMTPRRLRGKAYRPQDGGDYRMRLFLEAVDFPMVGDRFNIANASVPPARVGLTQSERDLLSDFMTTGGTRNLEAVIEMIGRAVPRGPVTFLRTHDAVAGWLGRWEGAYDYNLHPCKTPILGVVIHRDGRSRVLSPHPVSASCRSKASTTERLDTELCGSVEGLVTCVRLPSGPPVYVVEWTPRGIAVQGVEESG